MATSARRAQARQRTNIRESISPRAPARTSSPSATAGSSERIPALAKSFASCGSIRVVPGTLHIVASTLSSTQTSAPHPIPAPPAGEAAPSPPADPEPPPPMVDERAVEAAALLGVEASASEDEVRAALRARLSASRLHPDHGGDADEAKRLIA